jgi:hypothetical protein
MRAEGLPVPPEGVPDYRPPPRPAPDHQALEAERVKMTQTPPPMAQPPIAPRVPSVMVYQLPLGHGKAAEIRLLGDIGPKDIQRLIKYVELMADIEPPPPPAQPVSNGNAKRPRK